MQAQYVAFGCILAAAQMLPCREFVGDAWCVAAAMLAGGVAQIGQIGDKPLSWTHVVSELGCSAILGFWTHAGMVGITDNMRAILSASLVAGFAGSKGMQKLLDRWMADRGGPPNDL